MSYLQFVERYIVTEHPEYWACLDEFRKPDGTQMMLAHIEVDPLRFSPDVRKRLADEWAAFRECTPALIWAIEPEPDDAKWQRFVSRFGFTDTDCRIDFDDGKARRLFVSRKDISDERQEHHDREQEDGAVGSTRALPH